MKVYRVSHAQELIVGLPSQITDSRYFFSRDAALRQADRSARIFAAIGNCDLARHNVDRFGVLAVWQDRYPDPRYEVKVEEGDIEDAPEVLHSADIGGDVPGGGAS